MIGYRLRATVPLEFVHVSLVGVGGAMVVRFDGGYGATIIHAGRMSTV
jgi:hypothetical protein